VIDIPSTRAASPATAGDLLELVRTGRAATRGDLARVTGLSRTAVTTRLASLVAAGLLVEGAEAPSTGGRPPASLVFNADAGVVLAGAIGRSRSQLAVCDLDGRELAAHDHDQQVGLGPDQLMPDVVGYLAELLASTGRTGEDVRGVGLSISGTVDTARGASLDSPVMAGWDGVELAPYLRGLTAAPVFVDNDAHVLALAERDGHLATFDNVLVVKASTGLGMGVVADGRVVPGELGASGEIGHCKIEAAAGLPCRCGDTGCLEAVAGGWALVQRLVEQGRRATHVRDAVALALAGDPVARGLLRDCGRRLGEVLAVAINILNPRAVVLGGDMSAAFDIVAAGLRESIYARATALATRDLRFLPATHGDRSGVVGCAALALAHVLSPAAVDAELTLGRVAAISPGYRG
jgi:predicted NBD/HSP70 family sugar kinase